MTHVPDAVTPYSASLPVQLKGVPLVPVIRTPVVGVTDESPIHTSFVPLETSPTKFLERAATMSVGGEVEVVTVICPVEIVMSDPRPSLSVNVDRASDRGSQRYNFKKTIRWPL